MLETRKKIWIKFLENYGRKLLEEEKLHKKILAIYLNLIKQIDLLLFQINFQNRKMNN